ncbi:MAG: extracellular solute-binding protein [Dactylosporangium sp.]|nr:extracellular solute-binding protein [Dactylosporangium sp.]
MIITGIVNCSAACGTAGPGAGSADTVHVWALTDPQNEPLIQAGIDDFNETSRVKLELTTYVNDAYKQKLQVSMGSPNAPDVFFNWGGGNLSQFVQADQVVDLTDALRQEPSVASSFIPSILSAGKINGKQYALPMNGMQPVILFYNRKVFSNAGLQPPKTFDDLLRLVSAFKARDVIPIALAGSQGWTELMYLEYLLDRIGGPDKFASITAGSVGAWRDAAVLKALRMTQDLAERGAFGATFSSVNYDNTGASKLLATGKAAMHLMGSWEYSSQLGNNPDFVNGGELGWVPFPAVPTGTGDPTNAVGNPSNYFSISSGSKHIDVATDFLLNTMSSVSHVTRLVDSGQVPAVKGIETQLAGTSNGEFTTFTYRLVSDAPSFTQSWDQALSPSLSSELLTNLQKLFLAQITPEEFVTTLEKAK